MTLKRGPGESRSQRSRHFTPIIIEEMCPNLLGLHLTSIVNRRNDPVLRPLHQRDLLVRPL